MPRSPSTVRVTRVVATTSRLSPASSGSSSTTLCTSVVAPPTSTTTVSPATSARSSTPVRTTSGVAPCTIARKSSRLLRCLPPITWDRNSSRIAVRAPSGARTPIRGTMLGATTSGLAARISATSSRASVMPATTTGPLQLVASARAQARIGSGLPPSVPPVSRTTSGSLSPTRPRSSSRPAARTATTLPPLDSATRRPASAVTSSSLPTTAIRRPPPALEQARVGASAARASCATRAARHASYPSRTSVSIVVGCSAAADDPAVGQVDQRRLGERRAEVDADDGGARRRLGHRTRHGRGRRSGRRRSRCRR